MDKEQEVKKLVEQFGYQEIRNILNRMEQHEKNSEFSEKWFEYRENEGCSLEKEMEVFDKNQADLLKKYEKGYVVIYKDEILDVWNDKEDALNEGIKKYGLYACFLVRDISSDVNSTINISKSLGFH